MNEPEFDRIMQVCTLTHDLTQLQNARRAVRAIKTSDVEHEEENAIEAIDYLIEMIERSSKINWKELNA